MTPCIYALRHQASRRFIIGSTTDLDARRKSWKRAFRYRKIPKALSAVSPRFEDWEFVVLEEEADRLQLRYKEAIFILRALDLMPDRVLNTERMNIEPGRELARSTYYARLARGLSHAAALGQARLNAPKTKILDGGRELSQAEAASMLGCRSATLAKRLHNYRKQHPYADTVTMYYLSEMTRNYRTHLRT
jgi:hypothetical protein